MRPYHLDLTRAMPTLLANHLQQLRQRSFVGRSAERDLFCRALMAEALPFNVRFFLCASPDLWEGVLTYADLERLKACEIDL